MQGHGLRHIHRDDGVKSGVWVPAESFDHSHRLVPRDGDAGTVIREGAFQLWGGVERVVLDGNRAQHDASEESVDMLGAVGHEECDAVTPTHPERVEPGGSPSYFLVDIFPRLFGTEEGNAWSVAKLSQVVAVNGGQCHALIIQLVAGPIGVVL